MDQMDKLEAVIARAVEAHNAGRLDEAQALFDSALALSPGHGAVLHCLGLLAQQQAKHERSLDFFARAAASDIPCPAPAAFHVSYAGALGRAGRHKEALTAAERGLAMTPESADALYIK